MSDDLLLFLATSRCRAAILGGAGEISAANEAAETFGVEAMLVLDLSNRALEACSQARQQPIEPDPNEPVRRPVGRPRKLRSEEIDQQLFKDLPAPDPKPPQLEPHHDD